MAGGGGRGPIARQAVVYRADSKGQPLTGVPPQAGSVPVQSSYSAPRRDSASRTGSDPMDMAVAAGLGAMVGGMFGD